MRMDFDCFFKCKVKYQSSSVIQNKFLNPNLPLLYVLTDANSYNFWKKVNKNLLKHLLR